MPAALPKDPQFLYMMLVLPSLFGLTLIGEGLNKVIHEEERFREHYFWNSFYRHGHICIFVLFELS